MAFIKDFCSEFRTWPRFYLARRPLLVGLFFYAAVLIVMKSAGWLDRPGGSDPCHWNGNWATLTGIVDQSPDPHPRGLRLIIQIETIRIASHTFSAAGTSLIEVAGSSASWAAPGDRLRVRGRIQKPRSNSIPGVFNYAGFLANKNIYSTIFTSTRSAENLGPSGHSSWKRKGWALNSRITRVFESYLTPDAATVANGLFVGRRPRFHPNIQQIFIQTGTMHLLVASGSNIAFLVGLWFFIFRLFFHLSRRWALLSSLPSIWIYAFVTGLDPPIIRASIMATAGFISFILQREERPFQALGLSALSILIPHPQALFEIGFEMSFLTVFGLLYYWPRLEPWFRSHPRFWSWVGFPMLTTAVAFLWLFPLTAAVFKRIYPCGIIHNIFIIPLCQGGLFLSFLLLCAAMLQHIFPFLYGITIFFSEVTQIYFDALLATVRFLAMHMSPDFWMSSPGYLWTIGFYGACLSIVFIRTSLIGRSALFVSLILLGTGWIDRVIQTRLPETLRISWLNASGVLVNLIETPEGEKMMLVPKGQLGPGSAQKILLPFLAERGIKYLTCLCLLEKKESSEDEVKMLREGCRVEKIWLAPPESSFTFNTLHVNIFKSSDRADGTLGLRYAGRKIIFSSFLSLTIQEKLVKSGYFSVDILQSHFSPRMVWNPSFLANLKPAIIIETGVRSPHRPVRAPWPQMKLVFPREKGYWVWPEPAQKPASKEIGWGETS